MTRFRFIVLFIALCIPTAATGEWTALYQAAILGRDAVVKVLLEGGADMGAREKDGQTALYWAAAVGQAEAVKVLVEHGADVEAREKGGWTPRDVAKHKGHKGIIQLLDQPPATRTETP